MDFLSTIIKAKRLRVERAKEITLLGVMRERAEQSRLNIRPHRFLMAITHDSKVNIIAEFKRRSPSKGEINSFATPSDMARVYESAGAAAVSVLTEEDFFAGSLDDLRAIRNATSLPILRKDFIFDDYQIYESAAAGADALLLIVAVLDDERLVRLRALTEDELGMDALVEVHTREELDRAILSGARVLGINNRDLHTFRVSVETSVELGRSVPEDVVLISESGLNPEHVRKLKEIGYKGFLVGEALMTAEDPSATLREFSEPCTTMGRGANERVRAKICGITNLDDARTAVAAGADMLGFNFYRDSPRYLQPERARSIIETIRSEAESSSEVTMVGVFVDESSPVELIRIADAAGVDALQLHGEDSIEFCEAVKRLAPQRILIKVLRVAETFEPSDAARYPADAVMLDSFDSRLRGGTGVPFDWTIARRAAELVPRLFIAGGLSPENVADAIAAVQPYAVDACSSLEISPGKKSAKRMKEFVDAVRTSKLQSETARKDN